MKRNLWWLLWLGLAVGCNAGWIKPGATAPTQFVIERYLPASWIMGSNTGTIITNTSSAQFAGVNAGSVSFQAAGTQFRGSNAGDVQLWGYGSAFMGRAAAFATVENRGNGSVVLGDLADGQAAVITAGSAGALVLGAGVASNAQVIVIGDGNVSHGVRSLTADSVWGTGSGFHGSGAGLTGIPTAGVSGLDAAMAGLQTWSNNVQRRITIGGADGRAFLGVGPDTDTGAGLTLAATRNHRRLHRRRH